MLAYFVPNFIVFANHLHTNTYIYIYIYIYIVSSFIAHEIKGS